MSSPIRPASPPAQPPRGNGKADRNEKHDGPKADADGTCPPNNEYDRRFSQGSVNRYLIDPVVIKELQNDLKSGKLIFPG
ncbi:MAG: hypothetical protein LBB38_00140 [Puniceicoccales bacterium]|nr:hypothetical protein [Puniceicoccales bacterium]